MTHRLMCIFAHPDDETLGMGATLAKYAAAGVEIRLVCATRGQRGWAMRAPNPGIEQVGIIREGELRSAVTTLGLPWQNVTLLDYIDGELDRAHPPTITAQIEQLIRQHRPEVIITFGPDGIYGHPDHIAIGQYALAAALQAAQPAAPGSLPPHSVGKAYYMVDNPDSCAWMQEKWPGLGIDVAGERRLLRCWPDWAISAKIDASAYAAVCLNALRCHRSQIETDPALSQMREEDMRLLGGTGAFVRVFSRVSGGSALETDLFAGL